MSSPIEQYFMTKTAGPVDTFKKVLPEAMALSAAGAATAAGVTGMTIGAKKIYEAVTKGHDFRQMLESNPDLQEHFDAKPKFFNQAYSSLRTFNPAFARDPLVAGSYMRQVVNAPEGLIGILGQTLSSSRGMQSPMFENVLHGGIEGSRQGAQHVFELERRQHESARESNRREYEEEREQERNKYREEQEQKRNESRASYRTHDE